MYFILRYLLALVCVISTIDCDNVTYSSIKWPFDERSNGQFNEAFRNQLNNQNQLEAQSDLPSLINLYKDYKNNFIQIDDDLKYNRENQSTEDDTQSEESNSTSLVVNKSESEFRPTIDPIVPIIKRMLRRKDIRKEYPNYNEFKRRKGYGGAVANDETSRSGSNKLYNDDDDDNHSSYSDSANEEDDDSYYEDDSYNKKSLGYSGHHTGWSHSSLAALPLNDHYYTGSSGIPSYWNHGHYYPYYTHPHLHAGHHHYLGKYGKHLYREEYAIILVVISLAAFLGLIFSLFMPYALIQSQALTGIPSNTVPYTNAVTSLNNQFGNAAVTSDVNRIPIGHLFGTGRRRRKRMIRYNANRLIAEQLAVKDGNFERLMKRLRDEDNQPFNKRYLNNVFSPYRSLFNHPLLDLAAQTTFNLLLNNL